MGGHKSEALSDVNLRIIVRKEALAAYHPGFDSSFSVRKLFFGMVLCGIE